jgi:hypothetical protein
VRSSLVSATTALSASERKVALAIGDIPVINGSLSRIMIAGVITVEMFANAHLCDRGRSYAVLPEAGSISYTFLDQWTQGKEHR